MVMVKTDIFWRNEVTGENTAWLMNGTEKTTSAFFPSNDPGWSPFPW